jgi:hypothetical protein
VARRIYLKKADGSLQAMTEAPFAKEDFLQELLAKYPDLLAGDQMDVAEARRWLLVARELGVPDDEEAADRWSLDHLFLDQDGIPTLVEVKRSSDTRIRREVVGQMLDYAANAVLYWPPEMLRARFEAGCEILHQNAGEVVTQFVGSTSHESNPIEYFWEQVKTNLQAGRIRLVFLADQVPSELQRIVEFLNGQMDPAEVLCVEVRQFVGGELQTLVPQVIGQTAISQQKKRAAQGALSEGQLVAQIHAKNSPEMVQIAEAVLSGLKESGLKTRGLPSTVQYGIYVGVGFLPLVNLSAMNVWFQIPMRAVRALGDERFVAAKQKINTVANFYRPEDVADPTKATNALTPRYGVLEGKVEAFVQTVTQIAQTVGEAVTEAEGE